MTDEMMEAQEVFEAIVRHCRTRDRTLLLKAHEDMCALLDRHGEYGGLMVALFGSAISLVAQQGAEGLKTASDRILAGIKDAPSA